MTLASALAAAGCRDSIPDVDACSEARAGSIDGAAVGQGEPDLFTALSDGDAVDFVHGSQGSTMLPIRFRLTGADVPPCVEHETTVRLCETGPRCDDAPVAAHTLAPLRTYARDTSARETRPLYLVLDYTPQRGTTIDLRSTIAGVELAVGVVAEAAATASDAAPGSDGAAATDAASPDGSPANDAGTADATLADAALAGGDGI
jgi:hypothetical protein